MTECLHEFEAKFTMAETQTCKHCGQVVIAPYGRTWNEAMRLATAAIAAKDVEIEAQRQIVARLRREIDVNQLAAMRYAEAKDAELSG